MFGQIKKEDSLLLVIDIQERLIPVIQEQKTLFNNVNKLIQGIKIIGVPTLFTEQYSQGLGPTCKEIDRTENTPIIEKISFSCMRSDEVKKRLNELKIRSIILCGIETHICVLQTALDALSQDYKVHVVADAVSSRTDENKQLGLERMKQSGAFMVSTEMVLFQLLNRSGTEEFKGISKLIK